MAKTALRITFGTLALHGAIIDVLVVTLNPRKAQAMKKITFEPTIHTFDIDFMRHVSNITYIRWMEIGRCLLLEAVDLPVSRVAEQGFGPVLVQTNISYKRPLVLGDKVHAELWLSELSNASAWIDFRFHNATSELAATGRQCGLFIDLASGRPMRLNPELRARFEPYLIEDSLTASGAQADT